MTNQNKAHAVNVGSVYKPIGKSGLINVASDGAIINHFGTDATGNSIHAMGVARIGYNSISLKSWLYPTAVLGGFVLPLNYRAMRAHNRATCTRTSLGVLVSGNAPYVHDVESTPTLTGDFQSQIHGGHHA
jgi:hypothetical protein